MRVISALMAIQLFMLPQMITAQSVVTILEERGAQPPSILEEEVLKHAVDFREQVPVPRLERAMVAQFHQYEEAMLDHPLLEVPHQPPRS